MRPVSPKAAAAFSLTEMIITIAVIGIIASLAIPSVGTVLKGSKKGVAGNLVETLNQATKQFNHSQYDLRTAPNASSGDDEILILRTLQWRDPNPEGELNVPGPFMKTDWSPATSASADDYRAEWTGSAWRLLEPETSGAGLKIVFDGSDLGKPYLHAPGFTPAGSR